MAVARRGDAPLAQVAKDFGITESCLRNWLRRTNADDGHRPGTTSQESARDPRPAAPAAPAIAFVPI